jgi:hypothetical protein
MGKNGGESKRSGWHLRQEKQFFGDFGAEPAAAPGWERFLAELGLTDGMAAQLVAMRPLGVKGAQIRNWVRRHYGRRFVPEPVLEALGAVVKDACDMRTGPSPLNVKAWE